MRTTPWLLSVLLASPLIGSPVDAEACSIRPMISERAPLVILATARSDTVLAGPSRTFTQRRGPDGRPLAVYGQRFRLDRAAGEVPPALAAARAAGKGEVVLVPYASVCGGAVQWAHGARWAKPGSQITGGAILRPRSRWVGGRPTFDVDVWYGVYPHAYMELRTEEQEAQEPMTPAQVFEMTAALPTWKEAERAVFATYRPLLRWARANPRLARRFPADEVLLEAQEVLEPCVLAHDPHPVAGTYRVTVSAGPDTLTRYFRTARSASSKCRASPPRLDLTAVRPRSADTTSLRVHGGATEAAIPTAHAKADASECSITSVRVASWPETAGGERHWRAGYDHFYLLPKCFSGSVHVRDALGAGYRTRGTSSPGVFREMPDGTVTLEQTWWTESGTTLEMRWTRVSRETLP